MPYIRIAALAAVTNLVFWGPSFAADVTLRATGGGLSVTGSLLSYDGELYRVDTPYGILTVDGARAVCEGTDCPAPGAFIPELMISGAARGTGTLVPALLEGFAASEGLSWIRQDEDAEHTLYILRDAAEENTVARIRLRRTTTAEGFADLLAEQADLVAAFRRPDISERQLAQEAGFGDLEAPGRSRLIALDALVPVAARENALRAITLPDIAERLAESGSGPLHLPAPRSGVEPLLRAFGLLDTATGLPDRFVRHADTDSLRNALASDPDAIGILPFSLSPGFRTLGIEGACGAVLVPDARSIRSEDYPMTAPHYLFLPKRRLPKIARRFLEYSVSPAAQPIIEQAGFVSQRILSMPLPDQGPRLIRAIEATRNGVGIAALRRTVAELRDASRLTPTFRFRDGSSGLDAPSLASVGLLAEAINSGAFADRVLILAGFSDGQGGAAANESLSRDRAASVRSAIMEALSPVAQALVEIESYGFGEAMPLGCDEDAWGRTTNRRVEVWLR